MAASKTILKNSPEERVGIFCMKNKKPSVIEYTEITEEMAKAIDKYGNYIYGDSHIMLNLFNIKIIKEISKYKLPYHIAFKKCEYIDENGEMIIPAEPNAYKFEALIFDAFEKLNKIGLLRGKREDIFAPIKNKDGIDSPETARRLYMDFYNRNK